MAYNEAFKCFRGILEYKIPKILSLFESIIIFVAEQKGDDISKFTLSPIRRYYETGVKSPIGEALMEYGFPTDAIRRLEDKHNILCRLKVDEAKTYCKNCKDTISPLLDTYERRLFVKALNSL